MLEPGRQIGRYEIQRRLGRGGMGTVYVAHDPVLGRLVAIKFFLGDLDIPDARERFVREARSAAALNHANIVTIHDFGEFSAQPFIVMEYIAGETLAETIRRKAPVTLTDKLRWLEELCAGAAYAHEFAVLHRDIKPTNLIVDRSGRLKILDFGVARMVGGPSKATALIGTPGYMAPEQITGSVVDARSDLFAIGVVAYELLSYVEAFAGETIHTITHRILHEDPASLAELAPDVPVDIAEIVHRAMQKSIEDRHRDVETLCREFAAARRRLELYGGSEGVSTRSGSRSSPDRNPGTGSARQRIGSGGGIAQATPPPDPHDVETTPAGLVQLPMALEQAWSLLERGDVEAALAACEQALTLDGSNPEALRVERTIRSAGARAHAALLLEDAGRSIASGALAKAQALLDEARQLDANSEGCRRVERDLLAARKEADLRATRPDMAQLLLEVEAPRREGGEAGDAGETVIIPSRRTPLPARPPSSPGPVPGQARSTVPDEPAKPASSPGATLLPQPAPASAAEDSTAKLSVKPSRVVEKSEPGKKGSTAAKPQTNPVGARLLVLARQRVEPVIRAWPSVVGSTKTRWTAAGVFIVGVAIVAALLMRGASMQTGTLVIDAAPWAVIVSITSKDGETQALPSDASTPLALALAPGRYSITLNGPAAEPQTLTVDVGAAAVTTAPVARFSMITPDEYFEQYLGSQTDAAPSTAPAEAAPPVQKPQ